jgi:hypothetical protein
VTPAPSSATLRQFFNWSSLTMVAVASGSATRRRRRIDRSSSEIGVPGPYGTQCVVEVTVDGRSGERWDLLPRPMARSTLIS